MVQREIQRLRKAGFFSIFPSLLEWKSYINERKKVEGKKKDDDWLNGWWHSAPHEETERSRSNKRWKVESGKWKHWR